MWGPTFRKHWMNRGLLLVTAVTNVRCQLRPRGLLQPRISHFSCVSNIPSFHWSKFASVCHGCCACVYDESDLPDGLGNHAVRVSNSRRHFGSKNKRSSYLPHLFSLCGGQKHRACWKSDHVKVHEDSGMAEQISDQSSVSTCSSGRTCRLLWLELLLQKNVGGHISMHAGSSPEHHMFVLRFSLQRFCDVSWNRQENSFTQ